MKLNAPTGFYLCYPGTRTLGYPRTFKTRDEAETVRIVDGLEFLKVVEVYGNQRSPA